MPPSFAARSGRGPCPTTARIPKTLLDEISALLIEHSLYNGHPRFMGYITSSPAPLGSVAELVAATVNPNCGSFSLSPVGTLIEEQVGDVDGGAPRSARDRARGCS